MNLKGKVVLLTGGSRGIGKEVKLQLERKGSKVISPSRKRCNLLYTLPILRLAKSIKEPIDILINNAGIFSTSYSLEAWEECFAVNVTAPFLLIRELFSRKLFNKDFSVILNINSTDLSTHPAGQIAYNCSKAALRELTLSLGKELYLESIFVNEIYLPPVKTDMMKDFNSMNPLPKKIISAKQAGRLICNRLEEV